MEWIVIVTLLVSMQYFLLTILVGKARGDHGVSAPACSGNEQFERVFRVQQNTLEQLIIFFPALWIFGYYVSATVGAGLGLLFLVGRIVYAKGYIADPAKRAPGFILGSLSLLALTIGGLVGAVLQVL